MENKVSFSFLHNWVELHTIQPVAIGQVVVFKVGNQEVHVAISNRPGLKSFTGKIVEMKITY